jgi:hypothetical protein
MKQTPMLVIALSVCAGAADAQTLAQSAAAPSPAAETPVAPLIQQTPAPPANADNVRLPMDTRVVIELGQAVSSKDNKSGDRFAIRVATPIVVDGHTLVPAGSVGEGEVVYAEHGGGGGSPGKLVLAARFVQVGPVRVRLKAFNLGAGGESEFTEMRVAAELIGPAVMFIHGRNVVYPPGTRARAKVAEDVALPPGPPPGPPVDVAAPAPSTPPSQETAK